jgi:DNA-binding MurR/RpiR family transcriptional regulator
MATDGALVLAEFRAGGVPGVDDARTSYRPREVGERLGIPAATLRLWSTQFADLLSGPACRPTGGVATHRRYDEADVQVLAAVGALRREGLGTEEIRRRLSTPRVAGPSPAGPALPLPDLAGVEQLQERLASLPSKQYRLAQALLKTPEMIMFGSVRELARELRVNNATIVRFAQSLGYKGYQALQGALRQAYLPRAGLQPPRDSAAVASPDSAVAATLAQHDANLRVAMQRLQAADLGRIGDALLAARRILVCATGSPIVPATLLVRLLRHVGLRGELVSPSGVDRTIALYDITREDVVVGVGFWLTFRGVVDALALAHRLGARTVAITGSPTSPLTRVADDLLLAPSQGAAISFSTVATVAVVEALVAHLAGRRPERVTAIQQQLHDLYLEEGLLAPLLEAAAE